MESDFQRAYNLDLREALWGPEPIGIRRLWSLVVYLPPDSALRREMDTSWFWGTDAELLASLIEQVDATNRILFRANTDRHVQQPKPISIRRPWMKRRKATSADIARIFGAGVHYTPPKGN